MTVYSPHPLVDSTPTDARLADAGVPSERCGLGFKLFLLVNITLFIRPAEIAESLAGLPIYNVVISLCILASYPVLIEQLTWRSLKRNPATLCVLAIVPAIALSQLSHQKFYEAAVGVTTFIKIAIYFLLLMGLVSSIARMRTFLLTVTACVLAIAAVSVLNFHGYIHIAALQVVEQHVGVNEATGEIISLPRLQSLGIFEDPNDFSLILVSSMLIIIDVSLRRASWLFRLGSLAPLALLGYAFALTQSRGGFLSIAVGFVVLAIERWGWRRSIPPLVVGVPILLLLFGGRQTDISLDGNDTGMGRIMIWRNSLVAFHHAPLFGIGYEQLPDEIGIVSHNSYVHSFSELGLLGGTCFVGALFLTVFGLIRIKSMDPDALIAGALDWRPCLLAIVLAYATGIYMLSRVYSLSTYEVVGSGAAFLGMSRRDRAGVTPLRPLRSVVCAGVAVLVFLEVFVRVLTAL